MTADALILLANLGRPRRPGSARERTEDPVLSDRATAMRQLAPLDLGALRPADLTAVRQIQRVAADITEALLDGRPPDVRPLNRFAQSSTARLELVVVDVGLRSTLTWADGSPASALARHLIDELVALEPVRLRRCAREECDLVFYDVTRSRTRRWHAEDPCGWRERQRRHRGPT
jgi:predicted RNA-binding Zn ribbon-like protein